MRRTFLIDTDTASDDAVALVMALKHADVNVAGITVVSGNVPLEQATKNALYTVEMCGADTPVFVGAGRPIVREPQYADWFHGKDGLGDRNYPPATMTARREHAIDAMIDIAAKNPGLTLVTLGPLTNVALALSREPDLAKHIGRCVIMGGNPCCVGNVTPAAEFNIWVDPEAARIVLRSGMTMELIGWQLSRAGAVLNEADIAACRRIDTKLSRFCVDCNCRAMEAYREQTGEIGIALPDPIAMAVALDPTIVTKQSQHRIAIECDSELTRGMTIVDRLNIAGDARNRGMWSRQQVASTPVSVVWSIDVARWKRMLYAAVER
jgi:purine nucleosidase